MTRPDATRRLRHMLEHAREAMHFAEGRSRADLDRDRILNLALVRLLEIVGEAAARVPDSQRDRWTAIPWDAIIGLRNRLVHGYDEVDLDILWTIVTQDLPALVTELDKVLPPESDAPKRA